MVFGPERKDRWGTSPTVSRDLADLGPLCVGLPAVLAVAVVLAVELGPVGAPAAVRVCVAPAGGRR